MWSRSPTAHRARPRAAAAEVLSQIYMPEQSFLLGNHPRPHALPSVAHALDVVRWAASVHIMYYHLDIIYLPSASVSPACWGSTWVQFFFIVSGFGPVHSRLGTGKALQSHQSWYDVAAIMPSPRVLLRRLISVYPTVLVGLAAAVVVVSYEYGKPFQSRKFWPEATLTISYLPPTTIDLAERLRIALAPSKPADLLADAIASADHAEPGALARDLLEVVSNATNGRPPIILTLGQEGLNVPAWYISALVLPWLLENAVFAASTACVATTSAAVFTAAALVIWVVCFPFCEFPLLWEVDEGAAANNNMLSFDPSYHRPTIAQILGLKYVHLYFMGACVAHLLHARAARGARAIPCAASIGLALALALCFLPIDVRDSAGAWWTNGLISPWMPAHVLLLIGCVEQHADPLARVLQGMPATATACRKLSLGVYLLHWPIAVALWKPLCERAGGAFSPLGATTLVLLLVHVAAAAVAWGVQGSVDAAAHRCLGSSKGSAGDTNVTVEHGVAT